MWLRGIRNVFATFYLRTQTHSCELRFFKILLIVHFRIRSVGCADTARIP